MFPRFPSVFRFPNSVSRRNISTNGFFSHSNINNIIIRFRNSNCTNRTSKKSIRNILPSISSIICFPYTTASCTHIKEVCFARNSCNCCTSSASKGSYISPFYSTKIFARNFGTIFLCINFGI